MHLKNNIFKKLPVLASIGLLFGLTSCGSYQYVGGNSDGIYGDSTTQPQTVNTDSQVANNSNANNYYKDYFKNKSLEIQDTNPGDEIFTDIDSYQGSQVNNATEEDYAGYAGWGQNNENVVVNVQSGFNNFGWNRPFYGGFGFNNFGYRGFNNFGFYDPFYGGFYGNVGFYNPFINRRFFRYNNFYGNNLFYGNRFYNRNRSVYYGNRLGGRTITGRTSGDVSRRRIAPSSRFSSTSRRINGTTARRATTTTRRADGTTVRRSSSSRVSPSATRRSSTSRATKSSSTTRRATPVRRSSSNGTYSRRSSSNSTYSPSTSRGGSSYNSSRYSSGSTSRSSGRSSSYGRRSR